MAHPLLTPDPGERRAALTRAGVIYAGDLLGNVAEAAVLELVGSWAGAIGHGFEGTPKQLVHDIEAAQSEIEGVLQRLKEWVRDNPITPLDLMAQI